MVKVMKTQKKKTTSTLRIVQHTTGKAWRKAAALKPLTHPKQPIAKPWPNNALRCFDHPEDMGWGNVARDVAKSRGWSVNAPCHTLDDDKSTCIFTREFEATLQQKDPKKLFGKKGSVQEGYRLKKIALPPKALWLQGVSSDYRLPDSVRVSTREDFAKLIVKHRKQLPGQPGDYRTCGYPGVYNALAKTTFSEYFRGSPWYPDTYLLPKEQDALLKRFEDSPNEYWITKPRNDCSGVGICVMKADDRSLAWLVKKEKLSSIVQKYVADPVLLGGYKFHMRIHLVVTSLSPPEAYVQAGGQCLFCTKPYSTSKDTLGARFDPPVHLSNTGLNMDGPQEPYFMKKKPVIGAGQQVSMEQLEAFLAKNYRNYNRDALWSQIMQISKEVTQYLVQAPGIKQYGKFDRNGFFDMFGMDLMLDKNLNVWMCETNNTPGVDDQDEEVGGKPNPDFKKEHKCFEKLWNDIFTLLGLDAGRRQSKGTLKGWYQVDFSGDKA